MRQLIMALIFTLITTLAVTTTVHTQTNDVTVYINGEPLASDTPAVMVDGSTFIPMRAIFEALEPDIELNWDGASQTIDARWQDNSLRMWIGDKQANLNGELIDIPVAPRNIEGRAMVPLRVSEVMGAQVEWDGANRTVYIVRQVLPPALPSTQPMQPDGIDILMSTPSVNDKPLTEIGLLAGDDLVVQGLILNLNEADSESAIESMESVYQDNPATFYIRRDGDPSDHTAVMPVRDSSYRLVMGLPEPGDYEYYIQSQGIESNRERITVYPEVTPLRLSLEHNGSNRNTISRDDDGKAIFELTVRMQPDGAFAGNEIYYSRYEAFAHIKANSAGSYIVLPMDAAGDYYFVDLELLDDGLYVFYVEVMIDGKSAIKSDEQGITLIGLFYPVAASVFAVLGIFLWSCAFYILRSPRCYNFIISVSNPKSPNILTFAVHLNRMGKSFCFKHLMMENNRTKFELLNGSLDQRQKEILRKIQSIDIKFRYISKEEKLTVRCLDKRVKTEAVKLIVNDSMRCELENDGYCITLLFLGGVSTGWGF